LSKIFKVAMGMNQSASSPRSERRGHSQRILEIGFYGAMLWTIFTNNALPLARSVGSQSQEPRLSTEDKHGMDVGTTINFHLYPNKFVKELNDCFNDTDCRMYYYHFQKSGGTGVEERMARIFPPSLPSCCHASLMKRFRDAPDKFCKAKFSRYQVGSSDFLMKLCPHVLRRLVREL
jgi:hypothetical protein